MRIRQLEYFVAVAETLHFTRAAKAVGVSQPVLSSQIRALETELDTPLLVRTSRRVELTPAGESFLTDVRLILEQLDAAIHRVKETAETVLRVGTYTSGMYLERPILAACKKAWPTADINLVMLGWGEFGAALRRGHVDVAFLRLPQEGRFPSHDDLMISRLRVDPRVVIMVEDHPLAGRTELTVEDIAPYPLIAPAGLGKPERDWWIMNPRPDGSQATYRRTASGIGELLDLVSITGELGITTRSVGETQARPGITFVPLVDADPAAVAVAWHSASDSPSVRRFVELAKAASRSSPHPTD
ncbi:MAG: LysR family transcriptional regulator [Acidimicrobiia bacterium]|nr:LysR family transcriptional regulator [Acidimicrobiia bacterium]